MSQGVCNHGDTTNNDAEASFKMMANMREHENLFSSLLSYSMLERARTTTLLEEVEKTKARTGKKLGEEWPDGVDVPVPSIETAHAKLRTQASSLPVPVAVNQTSNMGEADQFFVESSSSGALRESSLGGSGFKWRVCLKNMKKRKYEEVCECGRNASERVGCKHLKRVLMSTTSKWTDYVKPWQTAPVRQRRPPTELPSHSPTQFTHPPNSPTHPTHPHTPTHPLTQLTHPPNSPTHSLPLTQ